MAQIRMIALPRLFFRSRETRAREIERVVNAELLKLGENFDVVTIQFSSELETATPKYCIIRLERRSLKE